MAGLLRALADDYGALAVVDYLAGGNRTETLAITVSKKSYTEGRSFQLARRAS
jgi:hypothetical protein